MDGVVGWRWHYLGSPPDDYHVTMEMQLGKEEAGSFMESERLLELNHKKAAGTELSRFPASGLLPLFSDEVFREYVPYSCFCFLCCGFAFGTAGVLGPQEYTSVDQNV